MELKSPHFENGGKIHSTYSCEGSGISPALVFNDVPKGAISLCLTMHDPDVPINIRPDGNWDHWVIFDMPAETPGLSDGEIPKGICGKTTGGTNSYIPPCPPDKSHRYIFRLYALDTKLYLDKNAGRAEVEMAMRGHIIEKAELIGTYCKKANRVD